MLLSGVVLEDGGVFDFVYGGGRSAGKIRGESRSWESGRKVVDCGGLKLDIRRDLRASVGLTARATPLDILRGVLLESCLV